MNRDRVSIACTAALALYATSGPLAVGFDPLQARQEETTGVYLDDSLEAVESLARMETLVRTEDWDMAARLAHSIKVSHGHSHFRAEEDHYQSVEDHVNHLIGHWPDEGLRSYRRLYEAEATAMLTQCLDTADLRFTLLALDRCFCTRTGLRIADLAGQLALEEGRFATAARIYHRILADHPEGKRLEGVLASRLAITYSLWDRPNNAQKWRDRMRPIDPADAVLWPTSEPLAEPSRPDTDAATTEETETPQAGSPGADEEVQSPLDSNAAGIFGGGPTRNAGVASGPGAPASNLDIADAASLWEFTTTSPWTSHGRTASGEQSAVERQALEQGTFLTQFPVSADGFTFVQGDRHLYALDAQEGQQVWEFHPFGEETRSVGEPTSLGIPDWYSPTCHNGVLFAAFNDPDCDDVAGGSSGTDGHLMCNPRLVALDSKSGTVRWVSQADSLGEHADEKSFDSSPLIVGDSLLITVRRRRVFGFEDCYLYRFDSRDGSFVYETHLGGASTGGFGYRHATLSIVATDGDRAYVATNIGTVAAVNIHTGRVQWLRVYPRSQTSTGWAGGRGASLDAKPWHYNPTILDAKASEPRILCMPLDTNAVLVLDAETGSTLQSIPVSSLSNIEVLLGVRDHHLYGVGESVFCYSLDSARMIWTAPLPNSALLWGRPLLSGDAVYVANRYALGRYDLETGEPQIHPWKSLDAPSGGNLSTAYGLLLAAGTGRITALAGRDRVFSKLAQEMEDHPDDPHPALELMETALRNGEFDMAMQALDGAIERLGGFAEFSDVQVRSRLFTLCLDFASVLGNRILQEDNAASKGPALEETPSELSTKFDRIEKLYSCAAQTAGSSSEHVRYRLHWAEFDIAVGRFQEAAQLYQQIISDRSMRETPYTFTPDLREAEVGETLHPGTAVLAGTVAERMIDALIKEHGSDLYADLERSAADRFKAAVRLNDVAALERVVAQYPNATVAPKALLAKAEILRERGNPLEAASVAMSIMSRYPSRTTNVDAGKVMALIASSYAAGGRPDLAHRWASRLDREFPGITFSVEGRSVSSKDFLHGLEGQDAGIGHDYPSLKLPLRRSYTIDFVDDVVILEAEAGRDRDWDHLHIFVDGGVQRLSVVPVQRNHEVWAKPIPFSAPPELLSVDEDRILLETSHQVISVDSNAGNVRWTFGSEPEGQDNPLHDWEFPGSITARSLSRDRLLLLDDGAIATCLDVRTGDVIWQSPGAITPRPTARIKLQAPWAILQVGLDEGFAYQVLDSDTGEPLRMIRPGHDNQILDWDMRADGRLILIHAQFIEAFDVHDGGRRWQYNVMGNISESTIVADLDGYCFSVDGRGFRRVSSTGIEQWRTEHMLRSRRPSNRAGTKLVDGQILVGTDQGLYSIDALDGRLLWEGVYPPGVRLDSAIRGLQLAQSYAITHSDAPRQAPGESRRTGIGAGITVFLHEYAHASGMIPDPGGVIEMGDPGGPGEAFGGMVIRHDAIVVQSGGRLTFWTPERDAE